MLMCKNLANGYRENRLVFLEIFETLPHTKHRAEEFEHWQELIHSSIENLTDKCEKPFFEQAHMGLLVEMQKNPRFKVWDISNRAVNFTVNNLKGIFFPDDDVEHLSIISAGRWSEIPKTTIILGEYSASFDKVNNVIFRFLNTASKSK